MADLVMIEWEDSAQPLAAWSFLSGIELGGVVRCASVGWLIRDDDQVKALAPNMGGLDSEDNLQVSGVIQIPASCVRKITRLREPRLTYPSSRPAKGPRPQAS